MNLTLCFLLAQTGVEVNWQVEVFDERNIEDALLVANNGLAEEVREGNTFYHDLQVSILCFSAALYYTIQPT